MRKIRRNMFNEMIRRSSGFTLVELIAVMIIMGLLGGVVTIGINAQVQKAKKRTAMTQISQFGQAISTFHLDCGFYPLSLMSLINAPSSGRRCKGYTEGGYLNKQEIPTDPWNNNYNYAAPGLHNPSSYDLWSNGPDGEEGTSDDIVSWASEAEEE